MFDDLPCSTDNCAGSAPAGRATCDACHGRSGYTPSMDEAWLNYASCDDIRAMAA